MINFDFPYCSSIAKLPPNKLYIATIDNSHANAWQGADIGFNWVATDYPYLHTHDHWEMHIQLRGTIAHQINGKTYSLTEGEACLLRPSDTHKLSRMNNEDLFSLSFSMSIEFLRSIVDSIHVGIYEDLENSATPLTFKPSKHALESLVSKMSSVQRFIPQQRTPNIIKAKLYLEEFFLLFLQNWIGTKNAFPVWLEALLGKLNTSKEALLSTPEEIAALTPYSYSRMSALFKQYVGEPLSQYLNRLKMNYGADLLANSSKSILDIALDCGYESLSSFNHRFTAYFGCSPSEYRKQQRTVPIPPQKKRSGKKGEKTKKITAEPL